MGRFAGFLIIFSLIISPFADIYSLYEAMEESVVVFLSITGEEYDTFSRSGDCLCSVL